MKFARALTVLAFLYTDNALAADLNTASVSIGHLQEVCSATNDGDRASCRAFIMGVTQGIDLGMAIADGKTAVKGRLCIPEHMKIATVELLIKDSINRGLAAHPEDRGGEAAGFVGAILMNKFPCPKSN